MPAFTGTPVNSRTYALEILAPIRLANKNIRVLAFDWLHTATEGSGTGAINLIALPPGKILIYPALSWLRSSAMNATTILDLGHRAYVNNLGATVAQLADAFAADLDPAAAAINQAWPAVDPDLVLATRTSDTFNTQNSLKIYATITVGAIDAAEKIDGWLAYEILE